MKTINKWFRKLLISLKILKMSYTHTHVATITNFLQGRFIGIAQVNIVYNSEASYSNQSEICLIYNIDTVVGIFNISIVYNKHSNTITLNSIGNTQIPFNQFLSTVSSFVGAYISFEQNKDSSLRTIFQNMT